MEYLCPNEYCHENKCKEQLVNKFMAFKADAERYYDMLPRKGGRKTAVQNLQSVITQKGRLFVARRVDQFVKSVAKWRDDCDQYIPGPILFTGDYLPMNDTNWQIQVSRWQKNEKVQEGDNKGWPGRTQASGSVKFGKLNQSGSAKPRKGKVFNFEDEDA